MTVKGISEHVFRLPSPVSSVLFSEGNIKVNLLVKRDDLIHHLVSGNKWRKLKYNFDHVHAHGYTGIVTCGGPWSNHLIATAAAAEIHHLPSVGMVRGDYHRFESTVIQECRRLGMQIQYLSNAEFHQLEPTPERLLDRYVYKDYFFVPLGGSNTLGRKGCREIVMEIIQDELYPDLWIVPAGTGTTVLGMMEAIDYRCTFWVFPAIGSKKQSDILNAIKQANELVEVRILDDHRMRFGQIDSVFQQFILRIKDKYGIHFDPLYNGKMLEMVLTNYDLELDGFSSIMLLHTGGLSGWSGLSI